MQVTTESKTDEQGVQKASKKSMVRDERGMTTAEYAVGTVAAATLGGVLIKVFSDESIFSLILKIILWILKTFTNFTG